MKFLKTVDWWALLKDTVLPHTGTLILYIVLFLIVGVICGIIYNVVLWRKKIYSRTPKYYNWGVKLYIVASMAVFVYFSIHLALIFAAKSIIRKEESRLVSQIYEQAAGMAFETPEKRNQFIKKIQDGVVGIQQGSKTTSLGLSQYVATKNTGLAFVDKGKDKLATFVFERYKEDIYTASLYGMMLAAGRGHIQIKDMKYEDFKALVSTLNALEPQKIESSIKTKLTEKVDEIVTSQINGLIKSTSILFFLILLIPIIEFYIYSWWMKKKAKDDLAKANVDQNQSGL